jgi:hypothetical protein
MIAERQFVTAVCRDRAAWGENSVVYRWSQQEPAFLSTGVAQLWQLRPLGRI